METFDPKIKKNDFLELVKNFDIVDTNICEGENKEWVAIYLKNHSGENLIIDMENEFSLFFKGWHCHYQSNLEEYEELIEIIKDILSNKRFIVCTYYKDGDVEKPGVAFISETNEPINIEKFREENGENKKYECSYWDSVKNQTFEYEI